VPPSAPPEQGQLVDVRQRRFVVTEVEASTLPASPLEPARPPQHLVTLTSVEDDADADQHPGDLREPEWQVFSCPDPARNGRDFQLRPVDVPRAYKKAFEKVVLVERLREVRALIGFTRVSSPGDFSEPVELPPERRAPLCRAKPKWVPTSEVRGEGIFLQFGEDAVQKWLKKNKSLEGEFFEAHKRWRQVRGLEPEAGFPGLRFVLLHSRWSAVTRRPPSASGSTPATPARTTSRWPAS
jgi:hypothetical protein